MRRIGTLALILLLVLPLGCSQRVIAIGEVKPIVVREGFFLDPATLPKTVPVVFPDGKTAERAVTWDLGPWQADRLYASDYPKGLTAAGAVAGTDLRATLLIDVSIGSAEALRLTAAELTAADLRSVMQRKAGECMFVDEAVWSPDRSVLALSVSTTVAIWPIGEAAPRVVTALDAGYQYHDLSWSHDGEYLAAYPHPSSESYVWVVSYPGLALRASLDAIFAGIWSPDSHELLIGARGASEVGIDLVVLDVDTGDARTILKSEGDMVYMPQGWAAPGVAKYDCGHALGGPTQTGLTVKTR